MNTNTCWLWAGRISQTGYGIYQIKIDGKWRIRQAHRLMYEQIYGEIPQGLVLDHLCRVTRCVNPRHLEAVTNKVNIQRGEAGKYKREITHCPKGHEYTPENTVDMKPGIRIQRNCRECRKQWCKGYYQRNKAKWKNYNKLATHKVAKPEL